ncbi:hypothetical protein D9615_009985 [Tricholomella constricta]|uniref:PWWP domain-containing protein n=1 Tax=Tricholomella constricta TaxID=117010 RepID=A0A8H5LT82_9AGAR|nr:hypothetical protein D9615_009985 [Tricholomella constricta]
MPFTTLTRTLPSQPSSSTPTAPPPRPRPRPRQKPPPTPPKIGIAFPTEVAALNDSDDSDLTPLTSPVESKTTSTIPDIPFSQKPHVPGTPSTHEPVPGTPQRRLPDFDLDTWDLRKLGTYVWVLVDLDARVLEPDDIEPVARDRVWWPGKIKSASCTAKPLKVLLFGDRKPGATIIEIHKPTDENILSLEDPQKRMRFRAPTFVNISPDGNVQASPRKKQKYDRREYEERWRDAVDRLAKDRKGGVDNDDDDEMPEVGTTDFELFINSAPSPTKSTQATPRKREKGKGKRKRKRKRMSTDSESEMGDEDAWHVDGNISQPRWSPPPPDELLQIPGELLLAQDRATSAIYWPAQILEYVPPKKERQRPKYRVLFLDKVQRDIPREWFFTSEENEFATCKLGRWQSDFKEVQSDDDEDNDIFHMNELHLRSPSPMSVDPPPDTAEFSELSIREQFAYIKPVLIAILNDRYAPARERHDNFIAGGSKRKSVVNSAGLRGQMDPRDVVTLQHCLSEWCLRDERRAQAIVDEGEPQILEDGRGLGPLLGRRSLSPTGTEVTFPSSQVERPPESSFTSSEMQDLEPPLSISGMSDTIPESSSSAGLDDTCDSYLPPPRQRGCDAYEGLSRIEKVDYCLNVLLPEAILQILLWRAGERSSVELLSGAEEKDLHSVGEGKLTERDWVYDVMRLREAIERKSVKANKRGTRNGNGNGNGADGEVVYGATGRPKRSVGAPKSYLE